MITRLCNNCGLEYGECTCAKKENMKDFVSYEEAIEFLEKASDEEVDEIVKEFSHLHSHTKYSLSDALIKPSEAAKTASKFGMKSMAITDHGVLFGIMDFYKACKREGVKPVIGMETYVAPSLNTDKEVKDKANYHLVLLAKDNEGLDNLYKIASDAAVNGFYYRARTDKEKLRMFSKGLIASSACMASEVNRALSINEYEAAKHIALEYQDIFGKGNFFLEIMDHDIPDEAKIIPSIIRLSRETGIPLLCTNDNHYLKPDDSEVHDILMAIQDKKVMSDPSRRTYGTTQLYFKSQQDMWDLFGDVAPEGLINSALIARRCNVDIEFGVTKLPKFTVPKSFNMTNEEFLLDLCFKGAKRNYGEITKEIGDRIEYEVNVVTNMGYVDYFLITWDFFRFCMHGTDNIEDEPMDNWKPIRVGPGRGSGAGSIMLYCLGITDIDPLKYDLMFERFLDPSRISMPDIDSDFQDTRRHEVIEYVIRKYGRQSISQIITFGSLAARGAMRDVGRALEYSYAEVDRLCKMVPLKPGITLEDTLEENPDFRKAYLEDSRAKRLIDLSMRLEGILKHSSTHAAGVLITDEKGVQAHVPLSKNKDAIVSQFEMGTLEDLGLLKMDFLGLKTLGQIDLAVESVYRRTSEWLDLKWLNDEDDLAPLSLIGKGYTQGIFQLEGAGMTSFMKELKPVNLEEWIAGISLYRPGPMQYIPDYLKNRRDPENISYPLKGLESILSESYGMLTYQEQCMRAVIAIAGYDKSDSDSFRKVIAKKKKELIPLHRKWFIDGRKEIDLDEYGKEKNYGHSIPGGVKLGHPRAFLEKFFHEMEEFGKYAFNKSHAAAYMRVGLTCARLKYYYPADFMAAVMSYSSQDSMSMYSSHCSQDLGIKILPPDVNISEKKFKAIDDKTIVAALSIKNSSSASIDGILEEREKNGEFESFEEFLLRTIDVIDKKTLAALAYCGALRSLGVKGSAIIADIEKIMSTIKKAKTKKKMRRDFDISLDLPDIEDFPESVSLKLEKEYLGFYVTKNPLASYLYEIKKRGTLTLDAYKYDVDENGEIIMTSDNFKEGRVKIIALLDSMDILHTKKDKKRMAKGVISDITGQMQFLIWPSDFEDLDGFLQEDRIYELSGYLMMKDGEAPVFIINRASLVEAKKVQRLRIFTTSDKTREILETIKLCQRGENPVYLSYGNMEVCLPKELWINVLSNYNKALIEDFSREILEY